MEHLDFENSKILKELGFDRRTDRYFLKIKDNEPLIINKDFRNNSTYEDYSFEHIYLCSSPKLNDVEDWFLDTFKIHITLTSISQESWQYHITKPGQNLGDLTFEDFPTKQEARYDAIKYLLQNQYLYK